MVFSSVIFLFLFLPIVLGCYYLLPGREAKNLWLVAASLLFYAFSGLWYVLLLLFSVFCNYLAGLFVSGRKSVLYAAVAVNLGILGIFKYLTFLVQTVDRLPGVTIPVPSIVLPVGISFFTFQGLSYVIDVYRNERLKSTHFRDVLLYIALFPQLVAGPIIRYEDVADEIHSRRNTLEQLAKGLRRVYCGPEQEAADRRYLRQCCSTDLQRRPLCAGQPDGLAGRGVLSDADLFRLQRIQRYGHRPGLVLWVPLQGKLQLSVHLGQYSGILAQMAYLPFHLVPGIPVYPIGRQPEGQGKDLLEQADRVFLHGAVAWCKLDLYRLGPVAWFLYRGRGRR